MSLCACLHDETESCKSLDLYDDDDFSFSEMIKLHFIIFIIALFIMVISCKYIAQKRY